MSDADSELGRLELIKLRLSIEALAQQVKRWLDNTGTPPADERLHRCPNTPSGRSNCPLRCDYCDDVIIGTDSRAEQTSE